mgnify:CR=1 FL=1
MNPIRAMVRMHLIDGKPAFVIFWVLLMALYVLSFFLVRFADGSVQFSGPPAIYIFLLTLSIVSVRETLPFALGLGQRRTDFWLATVLYHAGAAAASAVLLTVLARLEPWILERTGLSVSFFAWQPLGGQPVHLEWLFHFGTIAVLMAGGFFVSAVYWRFGLYGLIGLGAAGIFAIVLLRLTGSSGALGELLNRLGAVTGTALVYLALLALFSALSFLLLRRVTVR